MEDADLHAPVKSAFHHRWQAFLILLIDLGFITGYAIIIGGASVVLHLWIHHIEAQHALSVDELRPFKLLAWWLAWMDCAGAGFAATAALIESVTGRNTVLRRTINVLKRRLGETP